MNIPFEIIWIRISGVVQESTSLSSISEKFWSSLKIENPYGRISISGPTQFLSSVPSPPLPHVPPTPPQLSVFLPHWEPDTNVTFLGTPSKTCPKWARSTGIPVLLLPACLSLHFSLGKFNVDLLRSGILPTSPGKVHSVKAGPYQLDLPHSVPLRLLPSNVFELQY